MKIESIFACGFYFIKENTWFSLAVIDSRFPLEVKPPGGMAISKKIYNLNHNGIKQLGKYIRNFESPQKNLIREFTGETNERLIPIDFEEVYLCSKIEKSEIHVKHFFLVERVEGKIKPGEIIKSLECNTELEVSLLPLEFFAKKLFRKNYGEAFAHALKAKAGVDPVFLEENHELISSWIKIYNIV